MGFVMFFRLSASHQFGSHCKDFRNILHWKLLLKSVGKPQIWLKSGNLHEELRTYMVDSDIKPTQDYCCATIHGRITVVAIGTIVTRTCQSSTPYVQSLCC